MLNKPPPNNHESELAILGGLLLNPRVMADIRELLVPDCFYEPVHRKIYEAMLEIDDKDRPLDYVTLTEELKRRDELENVGGIVFVSSLTDYVATAANIEQYRDIVYRDYSLRRLIELGHNLTQACYDQGDPEEIFSETEKELLSINQGGAKDTVKMASDLILKTVKDLEIKYDGDTVGLATGFRDLDLMTGGLRPGQLIVLGGRPGMGKTSFALNIATNIAVRSPETPQEKRTVLLFSMEMDAGSILQRTLSDVANVPSYRIRNRKCDEVDIGSAVYGGKKIHDSFLAIDDSSSPTPAEILSRARRLKAKQGLALIVVDYLQLMRPGIKADNEQHSVSYMSKSIKRIARELEVPVILLSQLSRDLERRDNKRPRLSDLRMSGSIEQDADIVFFVYRDSEYNDGADPSKAELGVAKHRDGQTGVIELRFDAHYTRFRDG